MLHRSPLKRTGTLRRSPLARKRPLARTGLLGRRPRVRTVTDAERAWKEPQRGFCECGCGRPSWHLHRHHCLLRQIVQREGADVWSLRNSMLLHPDCHAAHHSGARKILIEMVPEEALAFAVDVLGEARAADYFRRRYACPQSHEETR